MTRFSNYSDDFYVNMHLNTEMDLPTNRDSVLHYFEQLQKRYPPMKNFFARERGEFVLEEDKEKGAYRWAALEPRRVCSGSVNPNTLEDAMDLHRLVLDLAPHTLSVSSLDCESLNLMFCFDFTYRGNHNELLAEALGMIPALDKMANIAGCRMIGYEPSVTLALDEDCRVQCRLHIETRTMAYHVRTGEFPEEQVSVYLTARRYGALESGESFLSLLDRMSDLCQDLTENYLVDNVLRPLQKTIAMR